MAKLCLWKSKVSGIQLACELQMVTSFDKSHRHCNFRSSQSSTFSFKIFLKFFQKSTSSIWSSTSSSHAHLIVWWSRYLLQAKSLIVFHGCSMTSKSPGTASSWSKLNSFFRALLWTSNNPKTIRRLCTLSIKIESLKLLVHQRKLFWMFICIQTRIFWKKKLKCQKCTRLLNRKMWFNQWFTVVSRAL